MPSRLVKPRPQLKHKHGFSFHQDSKSDAIASVLSPEPVQPVDSARSAKSTTQSKVARLLLHDRSSSRSSISLASDSSMNAAPSKFPINGVNAKPLPATPAVSSKNPQVQLPGRMNSTIRPVRSFEGRDRLSEDSSTDGTPSLSTSRNSAFSSSVNSNSSAASSTIHQQQSRSSYNMTSKTPSMRLKHNSSATLPDGPASTLEVPRLNGPRSSIEMGRSSVEIPQRESSLSATSMSANPEVAPAVGSAPTSNDAWDSSIGKAGLGKTGRVINKLVSDNEALKRDLQLERLRAEESKQTARLLEDKMERIVSEYESRLLEANVTKTLLARKERQVETLQFTVEQERRRAVDAGERERTWKDEMEKIRTETKRQVEDAGNHAALMEGRYNAISSHWRDQGDEVKRAMGKMRTEVSTLVEERRKDDDRINTLRELCDQQDGNIRELRQQKDDISAQFERYKAQQEESLKDIKSKARQREDEQERMLKETKEVLDKLRWALSLKENVSWAE